ncbi:MAG TPA: glycosyltransferase family A protein, partial [Acidimicrobiales bacterium]|nr:glycosyltransferase family A protein [Acidimicrobiales bacterium]
MTSEPVRLVDVELGRPLADVDPVPSLMGDPYRSLRILVRLHRRPLGTVTVALPREGLDAGLVADAVWDRLSEDIRSHCRADGLPVPEKLTAAGLSHPAPGPAVCSWRAALRGRATPLVTVVITTCGGEDTRLHDTVRGALAQTYPNVEVVVVDNRPATSGVAEALSAAFPNEARLRYAAEVTRGLARARNQGATVARGDVVAFTDDDVALDPDWLGSLVAGFDHPDLGRRLQLEREDEAGDAG